MQISPGVWSIQQREGGRVTCTLLSTAEGIILVDTGYDADAQHILGGLRPI
jgi:hypothetical protein